MNQIVKVDLYRYAGLTGIKGFLRGWIYPGFRYTYFLRKTQLSKRNTLLWLFYRLLLRRYSLKYGYQIPNRTKIGKGLHIAHSGTIVINPKAVIGEFCNLNPNIVIGQTNRGKSEGVPTIGDYVWIGANAVIVGNNSIGNNVLIAPLTYVNFDLPDNSLVLVNPGRIIPREDAVEGYINYIWKDKEND